MDAKDIITAIIVSAVEIRGQYQDPKCIVKRAMLILREIEEYEDRDCDG